MTPFTNSYKNIKHLGVTLTKPLEELYDKTSKTLKKEIEKKRKKLKKISEDVNISHVHESVGLL